MRNKFDNELELLNTELIEMGSLIEASINDAVKALETRDAEGALKVIEFDNKIDNMERSIERHCLKLLLQQQPVAADLRLISSALKMIADMERIGDHASDISEITSYICKSNYSFMNMPFIEMADAAIKMVNQSIDAFVNRDLDLATSLLDKDDIVDNYFSEIRIDLIKAVREDVTKSEQVIDFLMIAKYFERIGDHAENIAEWVIFSITGKHKNERIM